MPDSEQHPRTVPSVVRGETVQRITSARSSHSDDVARRMKGYAVSMGIRTLCVLGFILLFPHWTAWLLVPGAVFLPYVAVLLANAGRERTPSTLAPVVPAPAYRPALPPSRDDAA